MMMCNYRSYSDVKKSFPIDKNDVCEDFLSSLNIGSCLCK